MKIIIIGSPGAGKSTFARKLGTSLGLPVLHLDKIYHTGEKGHINRTELIKRFNEFADSHEEWIIDGNYISTMEMRIKLADTIILMDIPADICLKNAISREEKAINGQEIPDDMASGFIYTMDTGFIESIKNFKRDTLPEIERIFDENPGKEVITIGGYDDMEKIVDYLAEKTGGKYA